MREKKRTKREFDQSSANNFFERSSSSLESYLRDALSKAKTPAERKRIKALLKDFS